MMHASRASASSQSFHTHDSLTVQNCSQTKACREFPGLLKTHFAGLEK
jgi:hypothetical protein